MTSALPTAGFWAGRRVLVTGHTGFKGSWLTSWLQHLGSEVLGVSLPEPVSQPDLWSQLRLRCRSIAADIRDPRAWASQVQGFAPSVVFHLAAQPLVSYGYAHPGLTFDVNVGGTARLLEAVAELPSLQALVVITTDKVYDPRQAPPHREVDYLGGRDPYSASKAAAELLCGSWPVGADRLVTARAGNVIGGGDWAADRLLPDAVRAWSGGRDLVLRSPSAVRPWQHVLEPLRGYLLLAEHVVSVPGSARALNFGPAGIDSVPVHEVIDLAAAVWSQGSDDPQWSTVPSAMAEVHELTIDATAAQALLGWRGALDWRTAVTMTVQWYRSHAEGASARELVAADLAAYRAIVAEDGTEGMTPP